MLDEWRRSAASRPEMSHMELLLRPGLGEYRAMEEEFLPKDRLEAKYQMLLVWRGRKGKGHPRGSPAAASREQLIGFRADSKSYRATGGTEPLLSH